MVHAELCPGRETQLAAIAAIADVAVSAGVRGVTVIGERGVGKSTLALSAAARHHTVHPDAPVLLARAVERESGVAGAVLAQLLQCEPAGIGSMADELRARLASPGPSLLIVDDLRYADPESVDALRAVLTRHRTLPVTVLTTATPGDDTRLDDIGVQIRLAGLDAATTGALARDHGVILHPAMRVRLWRHTGGNPRDALDLLTECPRALWARPDAELPAPRRVGREVAGRLAAATATGRALIEALAILDDGEMLSTATLLAEIDDPFRAADDALATGLVTRSADLTPGEVVVSLRNPAVRAAVIDAMGLHAAGTAHERAARIVADPVARLAHRVAATSGTDPGLADELDALAHERSADGAWRAAAPLLRQAARLTLDPLRHDERLTRSVDALLSAGDCSAAASLIAEIETLRETPLRNTTLAYLALLRGRASEAEVRLDRAWAIVNADREPDVAATIAQRRVLDALLRGQGDELVAWADRATALAGDDSPAGVEAAAIRGLGVAWSGHPQEAIGTYSAFGERIRHGAQAQRATMGRGWLELGIDELDAARSSLETGVSMAQLGGSDRITLWALAWLARVEFLTGDWDSALRATDRGLELGADCGITIASPLLSWTASQIHSLRGSWSAADESVLSAQAAGGDYPIMEIPTRLARAQVAEARADYAPVIHALRPLIRLSRTVPALVEPGFWPWVDVLANALVVEGRLDEADALLTPHENIARTRDHSSAIARLGYARGRLLGAQADILSARKVFDEAVERLSAGHNRYDLARVNFAYGQTLRRAGKRRDADTVISTARDLYLALGATTYVARCERELKAGGLHTSPGGRDDARLTPQEDAVTALVVRGMSNKEVAAELFISTKTVQYHLTRIYAKLGLRSRAALIAARAGSGN